MKRFELAPGLGKLGEELATRYLRDKGYRILATNYCNVRKLARVAECYLREVRRESSPYHFDGIAVLYDPSQKKAEIRHLEHIFF